MTNTNNMEHENIDLLMNIVNKMNREKQIAEANEKMKSNCMGTIRKKKPARNFDKETFLIGLGIILTVVILVFAVMISSAILDEPNASVSIPAEDVDSEIPAQIVSEYQVMKAPEAPEVEEIETSVNNEVMDVQLIEYNLPSYYYGESIDFSSFQPYMDYGAVTNKGTPSYKVCYSDMAYTDADGMRRIAIVDGFKVNDQDDYVIALGTYYNGNSTTAGSRWLIETSNGSYTATVGDVKNDLHTDEFNMFGIHGKDSEIAGMIEFIVDTSMIDTSIKYAGSITAGDNEIFSGEILHIYKIEESVTA